MRALRHPRELCAPCLQIELGQLGVADAHRSRLGLQQTEQHAQQRQLATPARSDQSEHLTRLDREREVLQCRLVAIGIACPQTGDRDRGEGEIRDARARALRGRRPVDDREHPPGGGHALGARVVVGAEPAQRQVGLGREHEREQRRPQGHVAVQQAQPDRDRHQRHRDRRHQLEDQRRQKRDPQRRKRRRAIAVGDLADRGGLGLCAPEHLQRWQPRHDVQKMAGEPVERAELAIHVLARARPHERHEQRNQRDRRRNDQRRDPVVGQDSRDHDHRHDHRQQQLWQVQREVAVERVDAAAREDRQLAAALLARAVQAQIGNARQQRGAQLGLGLSRGPGGRKLGPPRERRACQHHPEQRQQRSAQLAQALGGGERAGDHVRQQPRLRDDQQRAEHAERYRQEQEAPRRARITQQAPVDGPHAQIMTESPCPACPQPARLTWVFVSWCV